MLKQTQNGKIKNLKIKFNIFVRVPSVICAGPQLHKMPHFKNCKHGCPRPKDQYYKTIFATYELP